MRIELGDTQCFPMRSSFSATEACLLSSQKTFPLFLLILMIGCLLNVLLDLSLYLVFLIYRF